MQKPRDTSWDAYGEILRKTWSAQSTRSNSWEVIETWRERAWSIWGGKGVWWYEVARVVRC